MLIQIQATTANELHNFLDSHADLRVSTSRAHAHVQPHQTNMIQPNHTTA